MVGCAPHQAIQEPVGKSKGGLADRSARKGSAGEGDLTGFRPIFLLSARKPGQKSVWRNQKANERARNWSQNLEGRYAWTSEARFSCCLPLEASDDSPAAAESWEAEPSEAACTRKLSIVTERFCVRCCSVGEPLANKAFEHLNWG